MIGDAGKPGIDGSAPVLDLLRNIHLRDEDAGKNVAVFLGDNIYPFGLHKKDHEMRAADEAAIDAQIDAVKDLDMKSYFIAGNHDYRQGKDHGIKYVKRQERRVDKALGRNAFRPDHGCPGPEVVKLGKNAVLILIDTQWWLHQKRRSEGPKDGCEVKNEGEFIALLRETFKDNKNKHIILAGHHPIESYGSHGGYFPFKDHLFPLTAINDGLYVPMPILGSIYPLYRRLIGDAQDIAHAKYDLLRRELRALFKEYPNTLYVAGHEHNLQYQVKGNAHYVVSGSGSKSTHLKKTKALLHGSEDRGFARVRVFDDGSTDLSFFEVNGGTTPTYTAQLHAPHEKIDDDVEDNETWVRTTDSITVVPNEALAAGGFKRKIFGSLYRDVWTAPITVPVMDIDTAHGGLKPLKKGGGLQTRSLRLEAADGRQYVFRSIEKFPAAALAPELRNTVVEEVVADGIAGSHPYAAIVIPELADAVGVNHTNPQLVFIPDHPSLGRFRSDFANMLVLYEERTSGNTEGMPGLGNSTELVGSPDLIENLRSSHKHVIDKRSLIRHRLFDMIIGDWDRHDDQWRWATYDGPNGATIYKPIPRDRDQAFFKQNGLIPNVVNRKWGVRKFQSYGPEIRDVIGQSFNARYLDRAYLAGAGWNDWEEVADSLKAALSDDVIHRAISLFPKAARDLMGYEVIEGLKGRRDNIKEIAREYYEFLARTVDVVGTDKAEFFEVIRLPEGKVEVNVFDREKGKKIKKRQYFHRVFDKKDTKEIRIYGLEGDDEYRVEGKVKNSIKVRIIGGFEKDVFKDSSRVSGLAHKTIIYDSKEKKKKQKTKAKLGKEAKLRMLKASDALDYDRLEFVHDHLMPLVNIGYNPDDGMILGGGFQLTKQGFKVQPFKWRHRFLASYALLTGAYRILYNGKVNDAFGHTGVGFDVDIRAPQNNFNFFGFGNDTELPDDIDTFRFRVNEMFVAPYLERRAGLTHAFRIGPRIVRAAVEDRDVEEGVADPIPEVLSQDAAYYGAWFQYRLRNVDSEVNPNRGVSMKFDLNWDREFDSDDNQFGIGGELALYLPLRLFGAKSTLALRGGGGRNDGFYHPVLARTIGGRETVRGLRRDRFTGNSNAFANSELRIQLATAQNPIIPFKLGLIGFYDTGRVWVDNDNTASDWHYGVGGGLFINPLDFLVLQGTYGVSDDFQMVDVRIGYFF